MIDTLKLHTPEFEIKTDNKLIYRVDTNRETGEIKEKKFYNSDNFNLTIDSRGLFIQFSLPKLYGEESNFYPIGFNSCKVVLGEIENLLKDLGVLTSLETFKVSRMDLFKNVETRYPFIDYSLVLHTLHLSRTLRRDYGDTFTIMNKQREICFYDKNLESYLKYKRKFFDGNVMRGEVRFKTHKENVKRGFDRVVEIPEKWDLLKKTYKEFMEKVFNRELEEMRGDIHKELLIYSLIREKGFKKTIEFLGVKEIREIDRMSLKKVLFEKYSKSGVYKMLKQLEEKEKEFDRYLRGDRFKKLYLELREKFLS